MLRSECGRLQYFYDKIDICFVEIDDERVEIKNATHEQLAAQDLKIVLGNPKLELEEIEMERCCFWHSERLVEMMKFSAKMSGTSTGKPMDQPKHEQSEGKEQFPATRDVAYKSLSPKNLSDLPVDNFALIMEKLDYKQQLKLRKVSKSLRSFVDNHKPACKSVRVTVCDESISIKYGNQRVLYTNDPHRKAIKAIIIRRDDFEKVAFGDLASTLKNPRLKLEELRLFDEVVTKEFNGYYTNVKCILESLNHQLSVKQVELDVSSPSPLLSILPFLKPGVLEKISLNVVEGQIDWEIGSNGMDKVTLLDQWKQAEELHLAFQHGPRASSSVNPFPMKYAEHFKRFNFLESLIDGDMFDRAINFLSKLENFEYYRITHCPTNIKRVQGMIGTPVPPNMSHHSIPDSDYCLEFSFDVDDTKIAKKICHLH